MSTTIKHSPKQLLELISAEGSRHLRGIQNPEHTPASMENLTYLWTQLFTQIWDKPNTWIDLIDEHQRNQFKIWAEFMESSFDSSHQNDKRFNSDEWSKLPLFALIKQSYLLTAEIMNKSTDVLPDEIYDKKLLKFYTQHFVDAMSPSNFAALNPDVMKEMIETNGLSVLRGFQNLMEDLEKGRITMTDEAAFNLGENLAISEGSVIFKNHLFELIQYKPTTSHVHQRPLLIVPPCINKFYILDLQPHNSFVKWCVDQGNTVFMISWLNPTAESQRFSWDDYVADGVFEAIRVTKEITGTKKINAIGWCVGGTILATAMGIMQKKRDNSIASATFLTTLLDFADPGEIGVFLDEYQVACRASHIEHQGLMSGKDLALGFSMLRSNDLIWSYVINNYLKGRTPPPFDILYWNSDSTNLSATMYNRYINEMYVKNDLVKGRFVCCGKKVELNKIKTPAYFLSAIDDHIAPWKTTFSGAMLMGGPVEFVLGESGHIAGVINPPTKNKRNFWSDGKMDGNADKWLKTASKSRGSWWNNWHQWLEQQDPTKVVARETGSNEYKEIVTAPGDFVHVRI